MTYEWENPVTGEIEALEIVYNVEEGDSGCWSDQFGEPGVAPTYDRIEIYEAINEDGQDRYPLLSSREVREIEKELGY